MNGQPPGKFPLPRASSRKSLVIQSPRSKTSAGKASHQRARTNAHATIDSTGPQSPGRPRIGPQFDERQTQRRQEEKLLQAIEVATKRNDDAAAEQLLRQLNELQLDGVAWQESLALKKPGGEERLQACVQELKRERETTALLKEEVQSVKDYLNALEVRIDESAARAKELTKEFDALFVSVRPET